MHFLWEQSWKVLEGTVELAEMYSKAIHGYLLRNASPSVGSLSPGECRVFAQGNGSVVCPKKREASSSLSQSQREGCLQCWYVVTDLAQSDTKPLGAENLVPAVRHRIRLDALGFIKTFSQELILGSCRDLCWSWMNVSSASQQITHNRKPMKPQAGC